MTTNEPNLAAEIERFERILPWMVCSRPEELQAMMSVITRQSEALAVARSGLEFYGNLENWKWIAKPTDTDFIMDCGSEVQRDFSRKASETIAQIDKITGKKIESQESEGGNG